MKFLYLQLTILTKKLVCSLKQSFQAAQVFTTQQTQFSSLGRAQEKVGTEIKGYHFKIKIEKSRFVKEASIIPITVMFDGGISRYSGLLEEALDAGVVVKPKNGWYSIVNMENW